MYLTWLSNLVRWILTQSLATLTSNTEYTKSTNNCNKENANKSVNPLLPKVMQYGSIIIQNILWEVKTLDILEKSLIRHLHFTQAT